MIKKLLLAALLLASGTANAQLYSKFGPVTGVLKGSVSTPQTSAAASSDIIGLWTGCTGSNFLRGDGTCTVPTGTGVTSVGLTAPSWYTVTGSPITTSGTLAITAATGQSANRVIATPDGTTGAVSLRALVAGDIPPINLGSTANGGVSSATILLGTNGGTSNGFFSVTGPTTALRTFTFPNASATVLTTNAAVTVPQGGTGLATLTANGVLLGEGTSNISPLVMGADTVLRGTASADPVAAAVPNCGSGTTALSYSTSTHAFGCQTITAGGTGTVTSLTGGTGVTASPSTITTTGSFAVDQSFTPTWTGVHTFSATPVFNAGFSGSRSANSTAESTQTNTSTGTGAANQIRLANNLSDSAYMGIAGGGYTGSVWTGGPTGEQVYYGSSGNIPVAFALNGAARFALSNTVAGENTRFYTNGTGSTSVGYNGIYDQAGTRWGYWGKAGALDGTITYESDANLKLVANNGVDAVLLDTSHVLSFNGIPMYLAGTYTGTITGVTATVTGTVNYTSAMRVVCLHIDSDIVGTSNANTLTLTGMPATIRPGGNRVVAVGNMEDNGVGNQIVGQATVFASGTITLAKLNATPQASSSNWTASGLKGINAGFQMCYTDD